MATKLTMKSRLHGALHRIVYPKGSTPLKWKEILILFFALMPTSMSITMLFPFLPAMVKHFGKTEEETGYYAGLIASSMFLGRFVASYFWGGVADKIGRRPVFVINLLLLSASMFAFGLSTSVVMALVTRFFVGLANGLVGIAKAMICELCDHTNQSLGMSTIASAYSTGLVFGPALGGFLSEVGRKYPNLFVEGSFFANFPFLLPCLVDAVLLFAAMIITYIWLPETSPAKIQSADSTKKEKDNEESKSFLLHSLDKKTGEGLTMEACDETKNNLNLFEKNETSEAGNEKKTSDICGTKVKNQSSDDGTSIEAKAVPAVSHQQNDVKNNSLASKSPEANDKDNSCNPHDSNNSKCSEQCTDVDGNDATKTDIRIYTTREKGYIEKDKSLSKEYQVEDEKQMIERDHIKGISRIDAPRSGSLSQDDKEEKSQTCDPCHVKDPKQFPSNIRKNTSNRSPCSSTKDSDKLNTTVINSTSTRSSCCGCSCWGKTKDGNLWRILRNFNAVLSLHVYSLYALCVIGSEELFNIWGATNQTLGGLSFSTDDLGTTTLVVGIMLIIILPTILPKLERKLGAILNFQVCVMVIMFCVITQPTLRIFAKNPSVLWPVLLIHKLVMRISVSGAFLSCFLLINNSVRPDLLCSINGLALSVCSLFRALAPSVGGSLFAWSISSGYKLGYPFNVNLAFIFFGFVYLVTLVMSCFISESLNEPKGPKQQKPVPCLSCDNLMRAKS